MFNKIVLITGLCLAPLSLAAQGYSAPSYTMNGFFPGMNGGGFPGTGFGGFPSFNSGGFPNNTQSPFMTMPQPQYPFQAPEFPQQAQQNAFPAPIPAQPSPFWMQTPPARYITEVPLAAALQAAPVPQGFVPGYTVSPTRFLPFVTTQQNSPPRWAPLPGQAMVRVPAPQQGNNWAFIPVISTTAPMTAAPMPARATPATPPKWPTP